MTKSLSLPRRIARIGLPIAAIVAFAGFAGAPKTLPSGEPAPALALSLHGGEDFDLQAQDGVTVLNFWASWCPSCREEIPELEAVHASLEGGQDRIVGLALDARSMVSAGRMGLSMPQGLVDQPTLDSFRVELLPTTIVVDREGRVRETFVGAITEDRLHQAIAEARE